MKRNRLRTFMLGAATAAMTMASGAGSASAVEIE